MTTNPITSSTAQPTTSRERGEGQIYTGSVVEARGATVATMSDCECPPCAVRDLFDPHRRVNVLLTDGRRLDHVGHWSLLHPRELDVYAVTRLQQEAARELRDQARTASMQEWRAKHGATHQPR